MADTYSKLLGLSETNPPAVESGQAHPAQAPKQNAKKTSKLANQQTSKERVKRSIQEANSPVSPTSPPKQPDDTSLLTTKEKTKYGTYLTDESIQKIRIRAIETSRYPRAHARGTLAEVICFSSGIHPRAHARGPLRTVDSLLANF